jgi:magnesium chelatase family protein
LLDRLDMHVEVPRVAVAALRAHSSQNESTQTVSERVLAARTLQLTRQRRTNAHLGTRDIERHCSLDRTASGILERATTTLGLSARAHHRILRVARTIADLAGGGDIGAAHVSEAISLRRLDRTRPSAMAAPASPI